MAQETPETINAQPQAIELAAAALRGEEVTVAKAAPVEDDAKEVAKAETPDEKDEKTEDVAKAETPAPFEKKDEEDDKQDVSKALAALDLPGLIAAAVQSATASLQADLAEVRKSLGVVEGHTQATMNFQSATTAILTNLKDNVEEQREVQKSVAATVEAVAAQPAGRRSAGNDVVEVAKSVAAAPAKIDLDPLRTWASKEGFGISQRLTFIRNAELGDFSGVPTDVRKAMGVEQ